MVSLANCCWLISTTDFHAADFHLHFTQPPIEYSRIYYYHVGTLQVHQPEMELEVIKDNTFSMVLVIRDVIMHIPYWLQVSQFSPLTTKSLYNQVYLKTIPLFMYHHTIHVPPQARHKLFFLPPRVDHSERQQKNYSSF